MSYGQRFKGLWILVDIEQEVGKLNVIHIVTLKNATKLNEVNRTLHL